jgi:hypothetical protein
MAPVGMIADASDEVRRDMSVDMSGLARALMDAFATIFAAAIGAIRHANASLARTAVAVFSARVAPGWAPQGRQLLHAQVPLMCATGQRD